VTLPEFLLELVQLDAQVERRLTPLARTVRQATATDPAGVSRHIACEVRKA